MSDASNPIDAITAEHCSPGEAFFPKFAISDELIDGAKKLVALYPEGKEKSAVLPIIHLVQKSFGYISPASMEWIAEMCKSSKIHVAGIVSFYPGVRSICPGKQHIRICRTLSCSLSGGEELFSYLCEKTGIDEKSIPTEEPIGISPDGRWSIEAVECLAACGFGPNLLVNEKLYSQVDNAKVDAIIAEYSN